MIQSKFLPQFTMERAGRLIGKLKLSPDVSDPEARARAAWQVAAGRKIAEHTRAASLVRQKLIVEVEDYVWQKQLNTLRHFLLRNLKEVLGEGVVTEIDFRPLPKNAPALHTPRMGPGRAASVAGGENPQEKIDDPVLALLYRQSLPREKSPTAAQEAGGEMKILNRNSA
jgi:hypothetical protein